MKSVTDWFGKVSHPIFSGDLTLFCKCCKKSTLMSREIYGYNCKSCGDMIGPDFERLVESPTNVFPELRK